MSSLIAAGAFGDFRDAVADASRFCQFVDHLGFDQRRVHIEHSQTAIAAEQRIFLEGDVDVQLLGNAEEFRAQCLRIGRFTAHENSMQPLP